MPESSLATVPLVYIIDDEQSVLDTLTIFVRRAMHYRVRGFRDVHEAFEAIGAQRPDVVLSDIAMEGREAGVDVLHYVKRLYPEVPVILMSAVASREALMQAVNGGAFYFLPKPAANEVVARQIQAAIESGAARTTARVAAVSRSKAATSRRHNHPGARATQEGAAETRQLVGESPGFLETVALLEQAAQSSVTVLLEGESGVGKGAFATYLHQQSGRAARPFLSINCGALAETLLESQLFGHKKGSFTGADQDQPGLVRAADGGTFFLDEVGELAPATQVKLLRVLQEREVIPVGGVEPHRVDVRFVAATNRDLRRDVATQRFREDLFWRLNVMAIRVPALRERPEDIPLLAQHALDRLVRRDPAVRARALGDDALAALQGYAWPGNVRELENAIERAAVVSDEVIRARDLPPTVCSGVAPLATPEQSGAAPEAPSPLGRVLAAALPTLAVMEQAYVHWVLAQRGGDVESAARDLAVPPAAIRAILRTIA